jgi:hypothetical protein
MGLSRSRRSPLHHTSDRAGALRFGTNKMRPAGVRFKTGLVSPVFPYIGFVAQIFCRRADDDGIIALRAILP